MQTARPHTGTDEARLLLELSRDVTGSLDLQTVLDQAFTALRRLIEFGGGAIQLVEDGALVAAATDPPASEEAKTLRIPVGRGISGGIAATGEPCYIPDIWSDPRVHPEGKRKGTSTGVRSYFGVPLILQGHPIGVLQIDSPREDAFGPSERALLLSFTPTIAAAVQNALLYETELRAVRHLREAEQMKNDFLALIPHELRTPLTTITGFGQTLAYRASEFDSDTVAEIGSCVARAGRRLERVMSDLFELASIERGNLTTELSATPVLPIIKAVVTDNTDRHPIELHVDGELGNAHIDGERLQQVLGNVVANSRRFSAAGSRIEIRARREDGTVRIEIEDHGRGIPQALQERVFERFFQVERALNRSTEGLGVGLYLVKALCKRMNATVSLLSEPGSGTIVIVSLRAA
jgi:signal transduction histidine kinase